jgi:hypothetical protein
VLEYSIAIPKENMSRPEHVPTQQTRSFVETMAACGIPQEGIARAIGIDPKTLRKHYEAELDSAEDKANANVAGNLYKIATSTKPTRETVAAAMFWLRCRAGWRDGDARDTEGKKAAARRAAQEPPKDKRWDFLETRDPPPPGAAPH